MTFILPNNATAALIRQFNDTRTYQIRVLHWLYQLASTRQCAVSTRSQWAFIPYEEINNITEWRKKFQSKTSLNLRSEHLTQERRGGV